MTDKLFVGSAKTKTLPFGDITIIGFKQDDLDLMAKYMNDNGYCNVEVKTSREGKPYVEINTYGMTVDTKAKAPIVSATDDESEVPF